ncbi:Hpt domain-containing protein [Steroidobacter sp.]|uniref:Hpt domain-containing protein n=1 Tax=Steroidobacter sp. TaxID=1978227 RepID=UPI001A43DF34|nr:Hpt domain-containing protein [Steroidobacter sp.]MBL8266452.1 Hpt domain-containing protein [Steroidobacter sp.]
MNTVPVLDRTQLLEITGGDAQFERELLDTYRASATAILARLEQAFAAGDLVQVLREAHALKGASLNVGASAMGRCAGEIESAARAGDLALASAQTQSLADAATSLWAELARPSA